MAVHRPTLNPQQQQAVEHVHGPLLVLAGAGSGKTGVITHKIAHLLTQCGYEPRQVAAVTFTNKAAREMRERVARLLPDGSAQGLTVSTFHSLGMTILQAEGSALGYRRGFTIFDSQDVQTLIRELVPSAAEPEQIAWQISQWKNAGLMPPQAAALAESDAELRAAGVYPEYQRHLVAYNAVDFDDLIAQPLQLFERDPEVLNRWQMRLRYLLVDEYQDTNGSQYALLRRLAGAGAAFTVVGDDDQSIYAWRGAQSDNLNKLEEDFPRLEVIKLEQNYRSTNRILHAANELISKNPRHFDKRLWSALGPGEKIRIQPASDAEDEARIVVTDILAHRIRHGKRPGHYAILYRSNHQAQPLEKMLREHSLPYRISGGQSFFERAEVKDLLAYLRLLVNPDDDRAFLRIINLPRREIGPATLEKLGRYAQPRKQSLLAAAGEIAWTQALEARAARRLTQFSEWLDGLAQMAEREPADVVLKQLIADIDYSDWLRQQGKDERAFERRWKNVESLIDWIRRLAADGEGRDLQAVIGRLGLLDMLERREEETDDQVQLMTLHAAKGLEFDYVYLVGAEEGLLPHRNSMETGDIDEERRLMYVGITRARKGLMISYAQKRRAAGQMMDCTPSPFLEELPADDIDWAGRPGQEKSREEVQAEGRSHLAGLRALLAEP